MDTNRQLDLAPAKYAVLKVPRFGMASDTSSFSIGQHQLESIKNFKDLGILISGDLKWSKHINYITSKASVSLYHIMKVFNSKNIWTLLKLYTTYVRPKLEFNTLVWSPYLKQDINKVEKNTTKIYQISNAEMQYPF